MNIGNPAIATGFNKAKTITKINAKTFYLASHFLTPEKKCAAYSIYAVCRHSDDAVDNNNDTAREKLDLAENNIRLAYSHAVLKDPLLLALRYTVQKHGIPKEYFDQLIQGMRMDLEIKRYKDFTELKDYCFKVAGVVGLIMLKIFQAKNSQAQRYAIDLGIAMQLTNIIRDIKEDYQRGRIYIPLDELKHFGVCEKDIAGANVSRDFKKLLAFQIKRAREFYHNSQAGISMIADCRTRFVVNIMKDVYAGILEAVEKNDYDVFSKRACVGNFNKIVISAKTIFNCRLWR